MNRFLYSRAMYILVNSRPLQWKCQNVLTVYGPMNHDACGPAINFVVELMHATSNIQIPELASLFQVNILIMT